MYIKSIQLIALVSSISHLSYTIPTTEALAIDKPSQIAQQATQTQGQNVKSQATSDFQMGDNRRPIWALAHMVNSIKELDYRLSKGANAVEADVTFGRDGDPLYTYHGPPCDCWRHCHQQENFNDYLSYVREIAIDDPHGIGRNLTLLFLDLKLDYLDPKAKANAGIQLAKSIVQHLYSDDIATKSDNDLEESLVTEGHRLNTPSKFTPKVQLGLIMSINHVTDIELVNNFLHYLQQTNSSHLMDRIGFDVGMNDDIHLIDSMWKKFKHSLNIWQGDGYTNCFSPFYNLERLSKALQRRDTINGYPRKVYHWTIDLHDRMRESLRMGVDAIMTNHPERLLTILREPDLAHNFRLATRNDDPFKKLMIKTSSKSGESARFQRSASQSSGGFFANLFDVVASWYAYIREIPFLSLPTTSRFMPKVKRHKSAPIPVSQNLQARSSESETSSDMSNITTTTTATTIAEQLSKSGNCTTDSTTTSDTSDKTEDTMIDKQSQYEGPKWYTSLASNILVSFMKLLLPEDKTST